MATEWSSLIPESVARDVIAAAADESAVLGDTQVRHFSWAADEAVTPSAAAESLAAEIEAWLDAA